MQGRTIPTRGAGGRPNKGERHAFMVRVPIDLAERVIAAADQAGLTLSDFIQTVLSEHEAVKRPPMLECQENEIAEEGKPSA